YADIEGASQSSPARLKVIGDLPAGYSFDASVGQGEALRIMTGAPVPLGADTVIRREDTASEGDTTDILTPAAPGSNIRRAGEDIRTGDLLFRAGTQLRPAHIGVLASTKRAVLSVYQRPRVAILSTGDELVDIDGDAQQGKIVSSNSYSLAALVAAAGGIPVALGIARDTREALRARLQEGMHADIIVSSGGVSVGDYDFVKEVLSDLGVEMKFWKVSMRPGQPQAFGMIGGKPTFGLPGNPVSVMVSFEQFVKPAMRKMMGHTKLFGRTVTAVAQERVLTAKGKKYFLRCTVSSGDSGFQVTTTGAQGSGILMSMAQANGLLIVPADRDVVEPGELVKVQVLDPEFDFTAEMNC
ncbi:MAG: molybdopterin molybdotransferase MoeA, partial [Deltaproteobacteria bacterium]|nr:molybdopterin molybdotransferase MoeA [Deltaproteobacteria bacterium]